MFKQFICFLYLAFSIPGYAEEIKNYNHTTYSWGGNGYDQNGKYYRFSAKINVQYNKQTALAIHFDGKEIMQYNLKYMILSSKNKTLQSIGSCAKSQKHLTAPVACYFNIKKVQNFKGEGELFVYFSNNFTIHENIDFDKLQQLISEHLE